MWNDKQKNMMDSGQRMKSMNYTTISDGPFSVAASRKRKDDFDLCCNFHDGVSPGSWTGRIRQPLNREFNLQQSAVAPQGTNLQQRTEDLYFSQTSQRAKQLNAEPQSGNYQFYNVSNSSMTISMHANDVNTQELAISNSSPIILHEKGPFHPCRTFSAEFPKLTEKCFTDHIANQPELAESQSYYTRSSGQMENCQAPIKSYVGMNLEQGVYGMLSKPYPRSAISQGLCSEIRYGNHCNNTTGANLDMRYIDQSHKMMLQKPSSLEPSSREQEYRNCERMEITTHYSVCSAIKVAEKENSKRYKDADHPIEGGIKPVELGSGLPSHNLDEKIKSIAGNLSPIVPEKLWDGSLQLSPSTMVSTLAFFKSGERTQDIKWPEHVEIKGKVRLQAFEKFIQELPHSRNRSLMVTSLCWKVGSSKAGLMGMKEVAKSYRESERVGFAQICSGFDLYVCPRSETIITILAKYGFFKGIMAIEEDQDSLIGCVVWRRSHQSSNAVTKKSDLKKVFLSEQPLLSPESLAAEVKSPLAEGCNSEGKKASPCSKRLVGASGQILADTRSSPSGTIRNMTTENEIIQSSNSLSSIGSSQKNNALETGPLFPYNPLNPVQLPPGDTSEFKQVSLPGPPPLPSHLLQRITESCITAQKEYRDAALKVENFSGNIAEPMRSSITGESIGILHTLPPLMSQSKNGVHGPDEDDDLPEFDFSDACGFKINRVGNYTFSAVPPFTKQLPVEKVENDGGCMPPEVFNKKSDGDIQRIPLTPSFQSGSFSTFQGISLPTKFGNFDSENKPAFQASPKGGKDPVQLISNCSLQTKSCWNDDDDDMPEWCPPELEHLDQLPSTTTKVPFSIPKTTSEIAAPHSVFPPLPPTSLSPTRSSGFLSQYRQGILGPCPAPAQARPAAGFTHFGPDPCMPYHINRSSMSPTSRSNMKPSRSHAHKTHRISQRPRGFHL
ncbi:uncharacterized protein [Typha angustifolia]|uniref:uncharacterized protein isoform X1 n=2 Tax=Typha angustifolia TaxID=59011 RepID=UPI003C2FDD3D